MKVFDVQLSPTAVDHVERIDEWWQLNRHDALELFRDELEAAVDKLRHAPLAGARYEASQRVIRRILMPRTRYHIYYSVDEAIAVVSVFAVWHSQRGQGPRL